MHDRTTHKPATPVRRLLCLPGNCFARRPRPAHHGMPKRFSAERALPGVEGVLPTSRAAASLIHIHTHRSTYYSIVAFAHSRSRTNEARVIPSDDRASAAIVERENQIRNLLKKRGQCHPFHPDRKFWLSPAIQKSPLPRSSAKSGVEKRYPGLRGFVGGFRPARLRRM